MKRVLRFLFRIYFLPTIGTLSAMSAAALVGSQIMKIDIFGSWYTMQPMFGLMFAVIFGYSLNTIYRSLALSMNCRRADFFLGCQVIFLAAAAASTLITILTAMIPRIFRFGYAVMAPVEDPGLLEMVPLYSSPLSWPVIFLVLLLMQPTGAALGELFLHKKALSLVLTSVSMLLSIVAVVVLLFITDGTIEIGLPLAALILGGIAVLGIVCDIVFYRTNRKAVVRL